MAKKKVNVKFLVALTAVVGGLAVALAGLSMWYLHRTSSKYYIERAAEAEKEGKLPAAANFLSVAASKDANNKELYMKAGEMFERCVSLDPVFLGKADGQYRRILELDPGYQPAMTRLMDEMVARLHDGASGPEFYTELKKLAEQGIFGDRNNPRYQIYTRVASLLQWMYTSTSSGADAATRKQIEELGALAEKNPDIADGGYYLSQAQIKMARDLQGGGDTGQFHSLLDEVGARHKSASAARPKNPEVQWRAAQVFAQLHDADDRGDHKAQYLDMMKGAVSAALSAVKPGDEVYGDVMALNAVCLKNVQRAPADQVEKAYRDWAAAQPHDPRARYQLADYLGGIPEKRGEAMELLSKPLDPDPAARGYALLRVRQYKRGTLVLLNNLRAQDVANLHGKLREDMMALMGGDLEKIASMGSSEDPQYLKLRGKLEELQGKPVEAIKTFERAALALGPNYAFVDLDLWSHLQKLYILTNQTGTAQRMMEDLLKSAPGYTELRVKLAGLYVTTDQLDRAREQLNILEANPPKDKVLVDQIEQVKALVASRGRDSKAVDALPEGDDLQRWAKATAMSEAGRPKDALHILQGVLEKNPGDEKTVSAVVELYMQQKNRPQAAEVVRQALKANPGSALLKDLDALIATDSPDAYQKYVEKKIEQIPDPLTRVLRRAALAVQRGDYRAAYGYLDEADKITPDDRRTLLARIQVMELERRFDAMGPLLDRASAANADGMGGLAIRTQVALERGDTASALKLGGELVGKYGEFAGNWALLGHAQESAGQYRDALSSYDQALQRQPNNLDAVRGRIGALEAAGDYAEEKAAIDAALVNAPGNSTLRDLALNWELRHGDPDVVVDQCRKILKQEPNNPAVYAALGQAAVTAAQSKYAGDASQAVKLLTEAKDVLRAGLEKFGTTADVVRFYPPLASALDGLGQPGDAEQALQIYAAHPLMKDKPDAGRELAKFYERHGRLQNAEEALRGAYSNSHQSVEAQIDLAQFLLRHSKGEEALKLLGEANGSNPRVQNQRIESLLGARRYDEATKLIQDVYGSNPASAAGLFYRGLVKLSREQVGGAIEDLSSARDKDPRSVAVQQWLSRALVKAGRFGEAGAQLEEMLRKNPGLDDARVLLLETYAGASPPRWDDFDRTVKAALANPSLKSNPVWRQQLARGLSARGQFDAARREIGEAQKLAPGNMALRDELVNIMVMAKDWPGVLSETDQQIAAGYKYPQVYGKRAVAHAATGDKATAMAEFETAITGYQAASNSEGVVDVVKTIATVISPAEALAKAEKIPDAGTRDLLLVDLYGSQDDRANQARVAQSALTSGLRFSPTQRALLLRAAADAYVVMRQWDMANKSLEELVRLRPNDVTSLNDLAYLKATILNSPQDAKPFSKHAYDLAQAVGNTSVMDTHGWVLTLCGGNDLPQAVNILQHLVDSNQNFTVARYHLAVAYLRQGGVQRASEELKVVQQQMKLLEQNKGVVPDELKTGVPKALEEVRQKSGQASGRSSQ